MKKNLLTQILAIIIFCLFSCHSEKRTAQNQPHKSAITTASSSDSAITTDSLTDSKGNLLMVKYTNLADSITLIFHNDTIRLKRDTMASGEQFSNKDYKYNIHQGEIKLTKNEVMIFHTKQR